MVAIQSWDWGLIKCQTQNIAPKLFRKKLDSELLKSERIPLAEVELKPGSLDNLAAREVIHTNSLLVGWSCF